MDILIPEWQQNKTLSSHPIPSRIMVYTAKTLIDTIVFDHWAVNCQHTFPREDVRQKGDRKATTD